MSQRRYSEVHDPVKLHNQLNRNVEVANQQVDDHAATLKSHDGQILKLNQQITTLLARVKQLEDNPQQ